MATRTLGTNTTTTLTAIRWNNVAAGILPADLAAIASGIKNDLIASHPTYPNALNNTGELFIPNRGVLKLLPGDYVAIDSSGWPILVSAYAIATASWTHT